MRYVKSYFSYTGCFIFLQFLLLFLAVHREQKFMRIFYSLQKSESRERELQQRLIVTRNQLHALTTPEAIQQRATQTLKLHKVPLTAIRQLYEANLN